MAKGRQRVSERLCNLSVIDMKIRGPLWVSWRDQSATSALSQLHLNKQTSVGVADRSVPRSILRAPQKPWFNADPNTDRNKDRNLNSLLKEFSLFCVENSLFAPKNSLIRCVGNFAASY